MYQTDFLHLRWYALMSLERVLESLGSTTDAASAAQDAAEVARLKGSVVAERLARETVARLRA